MPVTSLSPSAYARAAVVSLLSDGTTGFNPSYAAGLSLFPGAPAMTIDFSNTSHNSLVGQMDIVDILEAGTFKMPTLVIWSDDNRNLNLQKFQHFAGYSGVNFRVYFGGGQWGMSRVPIGLAGFEGWPDAIEHTVLAVVHNPAIVWGSKLVYNGDLTWKRSPVVKAQSNWGQFIHFNMSFEVVIQ